jgi:hypothetical protein
MQLAKRMVEEKQVDEALVTFEKNNGVPELSYLSH